MLDNIIMSNHKISLEDIYLKINDQFQLIEEQIFFFEETLNSITNTNANNINFKINDGKKIRASLLLFSGGKDQVNEDIIEAASTIEMLHYASLVHDDILDQEQERRGEAPIYKLLNLKESVLLGDFILVQSILNLPEKIYLEANKSLLTTISEMCIAEFIQLRMKKYDFPYQDYKNAYFDVNFKKTALLFGQACYIGSLFNSNTSPVLQKAFTKFGEQFGMAFQLLDDALEIKGQFININGRGFDALQGIVTLPYFMYAESIRGIKTTEEFSVFRAELTSEETLLKIHREINESDILVKVDELIQSYLFEANNALNGIELSLTEDLLFMSKYLSQRSKELSC